MESSLILITGANGWLGKALIESLVLRVNSCQDLGKHSKGLRIRCLVLPGEDTSVIKGLSDEIEIF